MTNVRLLWIALGNICLNLALIWSLYQWQVCQRRAAYQALCRQVRELCQQVGKVSDS
jgi:hypothetical protein